MMASPPNASSDEPGSLEDRYNINLIPYELFLKFRKEIEGLRVGLNLEFHNSQGINNFNAKAVLKPSSPERRWKFMYEPQHGDIRLLSKKIPITQYFNLQVGIGHSFHNNCTGWKWKISSCFGRSGLSQIRNKASIELHPGIDLRCGWSVEYIFPEIHGAMGTGEPIFNMNYGHLTASLDRVEVIITQTNIKRSKGEDMNAETEDVGCASSSEQFTSLKC